MREMLHCCITTAIRRSRLYDVCLVSLYGLLSNYNACYCTTVMYRVVVFPPPLTIAIYGT